MTFKGRKATDFTVLPAPANNCAGCWFAVNELNGVPICWANETATLVKQVFASSKNGSCKDVIAVLADEVNIKKTA